MKSIIKLSFFHIIILFSCNESLEDYEIIDPEEVIPFVLRTECNPDISPETFNAGYCSDSLNQNKCFVIERNNDYPLTDEAFEKFPNFCMNAPERIYFQNTNGKYQAFEAVQKLWSKSRFYWDEKCEDSTYCDIREVAAVHLKSLNHPHYLSLRLETLVLDLAEEKMAAHLVIYDFTCLEEPRCNVEIFKEAIEPLVSRPMVTKTINDVEYNQVLGKNIGGNNRSLREIYYSLEYGLVGFKDTNDIVWNLVI